VLSNFTDHLQDPNIVWVALSYTLTSAVTLTIIGRVSDIFGRRWVFVGGAALGVLGAIICSVAQNVTTLIVGTTIMGIAAATQLSYFYVMGELVPMKYRLAGNAFCYLFCIPGSGIAPVISTSFVQYYPKVGWRGCYYVLIGIQLSSFLCWFFFYHPPTFRMKHGQNASVLRYVKDFDYVGTALYTGGLLVFMMGLNWGGNVYAWSSAYVIATIVTGLVALVAFVLYECYVDLKEPLVPMHIFSNYSWNASVILTGLGASVYYAFAIVWPSMVAVLVSHSRTEEVWDSTDVVLVLGRRPDEVRLAILTRRTLYYNRPNRGRLLRQENRLPKMAMRRRHHARCHLFRQHGDMWRRHHATSCHTPIIRSLLRRMDGRR
jgi:MFS family permease